MQLLEILSVEEVLKVHEALVRDFENGADPISPPGVKSQALLESAVGRQTASGGGVLKYPDPISNAATLTFGICCDHPFHNGNKRTALVCLLVHLEKNRLVLHRTSESDLYGLLLDIAVHAVGLNPAQRRLAERPRRNQDDEVTAINHWLSERSRRLKKGHRPITYRQLRRVLAGYDFELANPRSNRIEVLKVQKEKRLFSSAVHEKKTVVGKIGYHDDGSEVPIKEMKTVRLICQLREEDGVDSEAFFSGAEVVDAFVNRYRNLLKRLAKT